MQCKYLYNFIELYPIFLFFFILFGVSYANVTLSQRYTLITYCEVLSTVIRILGCERHGCCIFGNVTIQSSSLVNSRRVCNEPWLSTRAKIHLFFSKLILNTYGQYLQGVRLIFAESEIFITIFGKRKRVFLMMVFLTVDSLNHNEFSRIPAYRRLLNACHVLVMRVL